MVQKFVRALILIPLAILLVAFAVANRQAVTLSFDPFNPSEPAFSLTLPLYALILGLVVAGVIVGGIAAWLRQGKWRGRARYAETRAHALRSENYELRRRAGEPQPSTPAAADPTLLTIPPPTR
jgi:uncharacterized integral membrane protein